jgi:hypothetical protein
MTRAAGAMRILYLADIRFPLERANGIQSMATCHALAARGHDVTLLVRPDTTQPARDPYTFYALPRLATLTIEVVPISGPAAARRAGYARGRTWSSRATSGWRRCCSGSRDRCARRWCTKRTASRQTMPRRGRTC